jgi:hypothetical protein
MENKKSNFELYELEIHPFQQEIKQMYLLKDKFNVSDEDILAFINSGLSPMAWHQQRLSKNSILENYPEAFNS